MSNNSLQVAIAAALAAFAIAPASAATLVIDQQALVPTLGPAAVVGSLGERPRSPSAPPGPSINLGAVQSFTAGTAGVLDHIDFQANYFTGLFGGSPFPQPLPGFISMTLFDGDYFAGVGTSVTTGFQPFTTLVDLGTSRTGAQSLHFDTLGAGYAVTPGQRYSVRFEAIPAVPNAYAGLLIGYANPPGQPANFGGSGYAGGMFAQIVDGVLQPATSVYDVGFTSYVLTADAVPEPSAWLLMLGGMGVVGGAVRRRRKTGAPVAA